MTREPLLRHGDPRWAEINVREEDDRVAWARERTIEELIEAGLRLSRTAHEIVEAVAAAHDERARPA